MVTVVTRRDPVTVPLSGAYAGVTVTLARLTSPQFAQARHAAQAILDDDGNVIVLMSEHDLLPPGGVRAWKRMRDDDPIAFAAFMTGIRVWVCAVECGLIGIQSWTGIKVEGGTAAPVERNLLEILMLDESFSQQIMDELDAAARILLLEGKP